MKGENKMDKWWLYNLLKSETITDDDILKLNKLNETEVREGIIEYLIMKTRVKKDGLTPERLKIQMHTIRKSK